MTETIDADRPVRILQVGAGGMGQAWLRNVVASADVELVGIVDLVPETARAGAELVAAAGGGTVPTGAVLADMVREVRPDAVLDVTIPRAHHPVTTEALFLGLPVLGEKPVAASVAEGLSLAAAAECTGELFMVSQSRRYNDHLTHLRALTAELGDVGVVTHTFAKAPHFGGFRDVMDHPLLLDMAIHPFDAVRALLGRDPVSVYCEAFNPSWSWYRGDAAASAVFSFEDGVRFVYSGSWCAAGAETSWNGDWRVSAAGGTALWDGDAAPSAERADGSPLVVDPPTSTPPEIAGSLAEFVTALRTGRRPQGEVHENVVSLAMVEAAVESAATGLPVRIDDVLGRALTTAIADEQRDDVRERLRSWPSVREALAAPAAEVAS
ncbi:gfo/Idh/MocA family oxidoreductase [Curtobacterium sp. MCBD17_013]|uniref:Gfo/Idh/MocA family protein n=1 Tax=unclassified Curtobacterium TaxID=257496 RepID=UPI000DA788C7|nr:MULTISPECIES: Gfo/Idh/MocA family oxidoreductase [unclassified Curtobacterium]PZE75704.1 gfo/Idh/MocA family oxidoreductase [Curtobacterium sp. MCBD17_019]PZF66329.1 gfo/Idh/MocA family oxidoreductase [Curtobacterium sp. MCBD17_013]